MKMKNVFVLIIGLFLYISALALRHTSIQITGENLDPDEFTYIAPFVRLVSRPDDYNDKWVQTFGYLRTFSEDEYGGYFFMLSSCSCSSSLDEGIFFNSIRVEANKSLYEKYVHMDKQHVIITGKYTGDVGLTPFVYSGRGPSGIIAEIEEIRLANKSD